MKSYILHGENQPESRKKLLEIVASLETRGWEVRRIDWHNTTYEGLLNLCRAQSLLISLGVAVVIENFFTNNKKADDILGKILKVKGETLLILWEGRSIPRSQRFSKDFVIQEFKIPVYIFKFLNSLVPGNAPGALKLLQEVQKKDSADFLFIMIARHVGHLIWAKLDSESLRLSSWQVETLQKQANKFTVEQLMSLRGSLLELDRLNKKSQLPENLSASLDLLVASI